MVSPERIYGGAVRTLSFLFVAIGIAILARTLASGGGPLSTGLILGLLFITVGVARLWISGFFRGRRRGG